jgi:hypothetical protein
MVHHYEIGKRETTNGKEPPEAKKTVLFHDYR